MANFLLPPDLIMIPDFFLNGMQFIYISEVWPMHLRAKGMSLGVAMISLMNIIWLQSAPTAFANIQWRFYLIFGTFCVAALIHVFLFFQETRGKSLEEMDDIFDNNTFAFGKIQGGEQTFNDRVRQVESKGEDAVASGVHQDSLTQSIGKVV